MAEDAIGGSDVTNATETALIVPVPEIEPIVGRFRALHDPVAAAGVPAHVTVLYPFLPPARMSTDVVRTLGELFSTIAAFDAEFAETGRFPGVLYFAPALDAPFRNLTERVFDTYPEAPPYGGQFSDIVPHLTIAHADDPAQLDGIAAEVAAAAQDNVPVRAVIRDVVLIEKVGGRWRTRMRFPLKGT
jgi:2'-5' RNA ligase